MLGVLKVLGKAFVICLNLKVLKFRKGNFMKILFVLCATSLSLLAETTNYAEVPVKNVPQESPLPIYKPEDAKALDTGQPTQETAGATRTQYGKFKVPPVTLRAGMGGSDHVDLPNSNSGTSFNFAPEFRFHEPYSIIPRIQYSHQKAFFGLRERGGLGSTKTNLARPEDTTFNEWTLGMNFGMELTPQDGFFHLIPSAGPFYRSAILQETEASMVGRPAFSGSELKAHGLGLNLNLITAFDIYDRYGFFVNGNWDVILDSTQRYSLKEGESIPGNRGTPGFSSNDVESMEKNNLSWQIGLQARF